MLASSSSVLTDDFDENPNDKHLYSSSLTSTNSNYHSSFIDDFCEQVQKDEDFPSDDQLEATSTSHCRTTIEYDPRLALLIEKELGLNDPQTSRKNAWGNLSYAELIARAIENSQDKRLTLSQIYSWMIQYVPYFRDKGDRKSSTGWKNSIRHNLSLHNRFVRIPNEIAGKSSWWTIDPRARQARRRRRVQSNENSTKSERRRLTKTVSNDSSNPSSFDYLFSNEQTSSSSDEFYPSSSSTTTATTTTTTISSSNQRSFTSVRDMNKNLYNLLQTNSQNQSFTSTQPMPNILHDMLKLSPPSTSNTNDNNFNSGIDSAYSSLSKSPSAGSQSPSPSHRDYEIDQMISSKLSKKLKTMDRSSPLFRRMVVAIMRHQMNKSKSTDERRKILSTPPSIPSPSPSTNFLFNQMSAASSMDLELPNNSQNPIPNSTFDLDVEAILDFERTTFGDCSFDIHDLPNL
jgi:hypothetical protein